MVQAAMANIKLVVVKVVITGGLMMTATINVCQTHKKNLLECVPK